MNSIFIFFPFLSAALYGLGYILIEKLLKSDVNIVSFTMFSSLMLFTVCLVASFFTKNGFSPVFMTDKKIFWLFMATVFVNALGWIVTQLALKNTSAEYVSFVELTYPVFTLLFLFMLFGQKEFNWQTILGGGLVMAGAAILVWAQNSGAKG